MGLLLNSFFFTFCPKYPLFLRGKNDDFAIRQQSLDSIFCSVSSFLRLSSFFSRMSGTLLPQVTNAGASQRTAFFRLCTNAWKNACMTTFACPRYLANLLILENTPSNGMRTPLRHLSRSRFFSLLVFFLMVAGWQPLARITASVFLVSYSLSVKTAPYSGSTCSIALKSGTLAAVTETFVTSPWRMSTAAWRLWPNQMFVSDLAPHRASVSAAYFSTFLLLSFSAPSRRARSRSSQRAVLDMMVEASMKVKTLPKSPSESRTAFTSAKKRATRFVPMRLRSLEK